MLRGEYVSHSDGRTTVASIGDDWNKHRKATVKPSTWATDDGAWRLHVRPEWGDRAVSSIRPSEVQAWIAELASEDRSTSVVRRCHGILLAVLGVAVRDRLVVGNAAQGANLPRKVPERRNYLTHAQVRRLADECQGENRIIVYVLAYTGQRWGELTALRVRHLDMLRRRILVDDAAPSVNGVPVAGTPKTHEQRSVPFPKFVSPLLAKQCEGKSRDDLVFGAGNDYLRAPKTGSGWLDQAQGRIPVGERPPRVTAHALRHTAASLAISAGATPKAVQLMLGHSSAAMTLDTYADLFEDDLDRVADRLEAARATS